MLIRHINIPERLTASQAAKILGISRSYIYEFMEREGLEVEKLPPRTTLIRRDAVIEGLRRRGAIVEVNGEDVTIIRAPIPIDLAQIRDFCRRWHITTFALFGSVLREDFRPDSDVDVLVTFSPDAPVTLFTLPKIESDLRKMFGRDVDLVSRRGVVESRNTLRRENILQSAEVIYHEAA